MGTLTAATLLSRPTCLPPPVRPCLPTHPCARPSDRCHVPAPPPLCHFVGGCQRAGGRGVLCKGACPSRPMCPSPKCLSRGQARAPPPLRVRTWACVEGRLLEAVSGRGAAQGPAREATVSKAPSLFFHLTTKHGRAVPGLGCTRPTGHTSGLGSNNSQETVQLPSSQ